MYAELYTAFIAAYKSKFLVP